MQFKGTPQFPSAVLDKAISRLGGVWNAFTFLDWTTYFETLPADSIDLALRLESDRMQNSLFAPDEVEAERNVILSERQGSENEPLFRLGEEMQAAAFRVHPYHHEVIGDQADLETMQREDLYRHYRRYYVPDNAVLAVAGDFDTETMLERIRKLYENIPSGDFPNRKHPIEPPQSGERQLTVEGPGEAVYLQISHRSPAASDPDFFPLTVLDSLLTGPSNLNMFTSGLSNKTSRLYRALVERELAVGVFGGVQATIDPFLHSIIAIVHPTSQPEALLETIEQEIRKIQESPPGREELARALKQAKAIFAYGSESITNLGFWLGFSEMFATYDWFTEYIGRLAAVTPEDVQRAAQTYLKPQSRVVGVYRPTQGGSDQ